VFSIADAWLFRPLSFPAADRLVVAFGAQPARPAEPSIWMPYREYLAWKAAARTLTSVSGAFYQGVSWRTATDASTVLGLRVTPEFFETFGVRPMLGRVFSAIDSTGPPSIVVSYGFWQRQLGGSHTTIGTTLTLSDVSYEVIGVMPPDFDVRLLD